MRTSDESLTVSELNNYIKDVITSGFPAAIWICGEVQELRDKKHLYFSLSEKDPDSNAVIAKIGLTIWANTRPRIEAILKKAENAFTFKDDIEVKLLCKVDFYPPFGQVRLIVESIDPTYTLGKIAQDRQRLIALLKQKGIFERNKQLPLPILPLNIGLVTSHDSAAYHDFMDELKKSGYTFNVWVIDSLMQGKNAESSVARAVKRFNQMEGMDVIVITRGGGAIAELSCFDSQLIAEAIAASRLPVLSGIGHEINTTVTDLTAHTYAKTPTAIARFLINRIEEFEDNLEEKQEYLFNIVEKKLSSSRQLIRNHALSLQQATLGLINTQQNLLRRLRDDFRRQPLTLLKECKRKNLERHSDLKRTIQLRLQTSKAKMQTYQKLIDVANPINTLKRGFSITRDPQGKAIRSIKGLKKGTTITSQLTDGVLESTITEIRKDLK